MLNPTTLILSPGQSATYAYSDATIAAGTRKTVRAVLVPQSPPDACNNIIPTVELQDRATGRTFALAPNGPPDLQQGPPQ